MTAPILIGVPPVPAQYQARPLVEADLRSMMLRADSAVALTGSTAGPAGIGKTTLAKLMANDKDIQYHFADGVFWLAFGRERTGEEAFATLAAHMGVQANADQINALLEGKRTLLILDDVWDAHQVSAFASLTAGMDGKLLRLVTTRSATLADSCTEESFRLEQLSDDASRKMLKTLMGTAVRADADEIAVLVSACRGNAAMLRSVAGLCCKRGVRDAINYLTDCQSKQSERASSLPSDASEYGTLYAALEGTLTDLSADLARCARMLAIFPEDTNVPFAVVSQLWSASGEDLRTRVSMLEEAHLIDVDWKRRTLTLIDLHLDYLRCSAKSELPTWHAQLLRTFGRRQIGVKAGDAADAYWANGRRWVYHLCEGGPAAIDAVKATVVELNLVAIALLPQDGLVLADLARAGTQLTKIDVGFNNLDELGALDIVRAAEQHGTVTEFGFGSCKIFSPGATKIAAHLKTSSVTALNLEFNCIDSEGVVAIASALGGLTSLNLSEVNRTGEDSDDMTGILALASALGESTRLTSLNLKGNCINVEAGKALAEAMQVNSTLVHLDLSSNRLCGVWRDGPFREMGSYNASAVRALVSAIQASSVLRTCDLRFNELADAEKLFVRDATHGNDVLQVQV